MEDKIPHYLNFINDIIQNREIKYDDFKTQFRSEFKDVFGQTKDKSIDNHLTENVGKILGLYYLERIDQNTYVRKSPQVDILIDDPNYTKFFREISYRLQIPSGLKKPFKALEDFHLGYRLKPVQYIVKFLIIARNKGLKIYKRDIYNYILSNHLVAKAEIGPDEVVEYIQKDPKRIERTNKSLQAWDFQETKPENINVIREQLAERYESRSFFSIPPEIISTISLNKKYTIYGRRDYQIMSELCSNGLKQKATSFTEQHSRELLSIMQMGGLISFGNDQDSEQVTLTQSAAQNEGFIDNQLKRPLEFDFEHFIDPNSNNFYDSNSFEIFWSQYWAQSKTELPILDQIIHKKKSRSKPLSLQTTQKGPTFLGNLGENIIIEYEKYNLSKIDKNLSNRVKDDSNIPNAGYDIESLIKTENEKLEPRYIEVKTTKKSNYKSVGKYLDSFHLQRSQWRKAQEPSIFYSIYRVIVIDRKTVYLAKMNNPSKEFSIIKHKNKLFDINLTGNLKVNYDQKKFIFKKIPIHILSLIPNETWPD